MFDRLIDTLLQFLHLFCFWFVVADYEMAVVLRFGKRHRVSGPGIHWKWPFDIERALSCCIVFDTIYIGPLSVTTKDDREIVVSGIVGFEICDIERFLLQTNGHRQVLEDSSYGAISQFIRHKTWAELRMIHLDKDLTRIVRQRAAQYGVRVKRVQVSDLTRSRSLRLIQPLVHDKNA